jgi:hypothetical protein
MTATGFFSGGTVLDITSQVKRSVTARSVVSVGNSTTVKGMVTAKKVGSSTIRASKGNPTGGLADRVLIAGDRAELAPGGLQSATLCLVLSPRSDVGNSWPSTRDEEHPGRADQQEHRQEDEA